MAALTAASWTLTLDARNPRHENGQKVCTGTLALAGTDTYPGAGGIPLPDKGKFGFIRNMDSLHFVALTTLTTEYVSRYNKADHKMALYEEEAVAAGGPLLEADSAEVPGPRTWRFIAYGW